MRRYIVFFSFLVATLYACEDAKIKTCEKGEVRRVEKLVQRLESSHEKLLPGDSIAIDFKMITCGPLYDLRDSVTGVFLGKRGPRVDYDSICNLVLQDKKIKHKIVARHKISFWLPGVKKKRKNPCAEETIRKNLRNALETQLEKLEPGQKDSLSRAVPKTCLDVDYKKIMKEEAKDLGMVLVFTSTEEEDGEKRDNFTLSRSK